MGFERTGLSLKTWMRLAVLCCLGALMVVTSPTAASANCEVVNSYQYTYYSDATRTQIVGMYTVNCQQQEISWGEMTDHWHYQYDYCFCLESGN